MAKILCPKNEVKCCLGIVPNILDHLPFVNICFKLNFICLVYGDVRKRCASGGWIDLRAYVLGGSVAETMCGDYWWFLAANSACFWFHLTSWKLQDSQPS